MQTYDELKFASDELKLKKFQKQDVAQENRVNYEEDGVNYGFLTITGTFRLDYSAEVVL